MSSEATPTTGYRVLIADNDGTIRRRFRDYLNDKGFEAREARDGQEAKAIMQEWIPNFIIGDLMLQEGNALDLVLHTKTTEHLKDHQIYTLVTSNHNSLNNVKEALKRGAVDYVIKPFEFQDMVSRMIFHAQKKKVVKVKTEKTTKASGADFYLDLIDMVFKEANQPRSTHELMFNLTRMLAMTFNSVRCSVIQCMPDRQTGYVRASHDDKSVTEIKIDLNRYPEVQNVLNTGNVVVIEDMEDDPAMRAVREAVKSISFNGIIVCPVRYRGYTYGVMSARMPKDSQKFSDYDVRFAMMVANTMSLIVSSIPSLLEKREVDKKPLENKPEQKAS